MIFTPISHDIFIHKPKTITKKNRAITCLLFCTEMNNEYRNLLRSVKLKAFS